MNLWHIVWLCVTIYVVGGLATYLIPPFFPKLDRLVNDESEHRPEWFALLWPLLVAFYLIVMPVALPIHYLVKLRKHIVKSLDTKREAIYDRLHVEEADQRRRREHADKFL